MQTTISKLKIGDFFTLTEAKETDDLQNCKRRVWVRDEYDRSTRKYTAYKFNNINHVSEFKANRPVWTGFTF